MNRNRSVGPAAFAILLITVITPVSLSSQHVGIGTLNPSYKLDVRSRIDTSLQVKTTGIAGTASTPAVRMGILNVMDSTTAGSRVGMLTKIAFSNSEAGPEYDYIGHDIQFDGYCFPIGSGCNESEIFGIKVDVPLFANDGTHYGIYASAPRLTGYAGYFNGRGYFSKMVGIGIDPSTGQQLHVKVDGDPLLPVNRTARFEMTSAAVNTAVEAVYAQTIGYSSTNNYAGYFTTTANNGEAYGVYSQALANSGDSYAMYANNASVNGTDRYGLFVDVTGDGPGRIHGIRAVVSGNSNSGQPVYGVESVIPAFTATGQVYGMRAIIQENATTSATSYAIYASNQNDGYSAYLSGRAAIVQGSDASYSSDGYLQMGPANSGNLVLDDNEILARDNGVAAPLYIQRDGGNVVLCGLGLGAVGIGLSSPSSIPDGYALAVNGKGIFTELRVELTSAWPDYVFRDDYDLPALPDVKAFIEANGHLPNVPTALEIEQDGLHLGEMQRKMMEKIEELTIYVIQLEEEIQALK